MKIKSIQDIIAIHLIPNRKQFPQNNSRSGTFIISQLGLIKAHITTSFTCKMHSKQSIFNKQETMTKLSLHKPMIKAMQPHT